MKHMKVIVFIILMLLYMFSSTLIANSQDTPSKKKVYITKHINPHAPFLDGLSEDPCWNGVEWAGDFIQIRPYEGNAPSQQTKFKIMYDNKNLYVLIRALDSEPDKIVRRVGRRDNVDGDSVCVALDSYHDHRSAFYFEVNAAGTKGDGFISNNGENEDSSWDPIWDAKTRIDKEGWTAEMRIPLSQLRFASGEDLTWGLEVSRIVFRYKEESYWQFISRKSPGIVHLFGELTGFKQLTALRHKQLLPYTVGKLERSPSESGNPFNSGKDQNLTMGLDGKIGITNDLTLDFTVNPDFGQVEADPSVVNLSAFETYYSEKRPFFIEGKDILSLRLMVGDGDFSLDNLFYSRRIGRSPQYTPELQSGEYLDMPFNTSILGALKLTGKTRKGLSIGILDALTSRETADIGMFGPERSEVVEPLSNYFAFRLQQDFRQGNTQIGGMLTAIHRSLKGTGLDFLHDRAYSGGIDFSHRWKQKTYYIMGNFNFSQVHGTPEAILRTQQSSVHLYQRPDAEHVEVDPKRTSLSGHGGMVAFGKGGNGLMFSGGLTWRSPGLELNDIGYLRSADTSMAWVWANYPIIKPFLIFRQFSFNFNEWMGWNFSGDQTFAGGNFGINAQFKNNWQLGIYTNWQFENLSQSNLRGGPSLRIPGGMNYSISAVSDNRKSLYVSASVGTFQGLFDNRDSTSASLGVTFRPSRNLSMTLQPSYSIYENQLQYVSSIDNADEETRYIMAGINQKTVAMTIRLDWSLTPELSVQFYGQPFVSRGTYNNFKMVTQPRAEMWSDRFSHYCSGQISFNPIEELYEIDENLDGCNDYSFSNPDFNVLEFRSNLVIRWEYRLGSTLYLVWSQGRGANSVDAQSNFTSSFNELLHLPSTNVFLVKFTYSFNF